MKVKTTEPSVGEYGNEVGTILDLKEEDAKVLIEKGYAEKVTANNNKKQEKKDDK